jgi:DNA invertase Pin-like site-specific DNA recombinase
MSRRIIVVMIIIFGIGPFRGNAFTNRTPALRIDLFLHQQGIDTTTPGGKAMFQMMGVFAEFERSMIQERVRAGLKRAVSEGKQLGRPPLDP